MFHSGRRTNLSTYGSTALCWSLPIFSFLILHTVGRTPWTSEQPVARTPPIHRTTQAQNKRKQTPTPRVEIEPMTPAFERAKTVRALDRTTTVIGQDELIVM
jgi:hypothetical protein